MILLHGSLNSDPTVLKERLPAPKTLGYVLNLSYADCRVLCLNSFFLVSLFLPFLRKGWGLFFLSSWLFSNRSLFMDLRLKGISFFQPNKPWLNLSRYNGLLRDHLARFQELKSMPNAAVDSVCDIGYVPWLPICVMKGWSSWPLRSHFVLLFYKRMIQGSTFGGKPQ